jgi:hypothetical protein
MTRRPARRRAYRDGGPGVWVNGDRDHREDGDAVDNAIKYTDGGGRVRLAVERTPKVTITV